MGNSEALSVLVLGHALGHDGMIFADRDLRPCIPARALAGSRRKRVSGSVKRQLVLAHFGHLLQLLAYSLPLLLAHRSTRLPVGIVFYFLHPLLHLPLQRRPLHHPVARSIPL